MMCFVNVFQSPMAKLFGNAFSFSDAISIFSTFSLRRGKKLYKYIYSFHQDIFLRKKNPSKSNMYEISIISGR